MLMKSHLTLLLFFASLACAAQIKKGQFLAGGSGTYSAYAYKYSDSKVRNFGLDGRGGIFVINQLAAGFLIGYEYYKQFGTDDLSNEYFRQYNQNIKAGPFVRYYLLGVSKKINVLVDASGFRNWSKSGNLSGGSKSANYGYAFGAGPAFFLNPNVSLEATLNYESNSHEFMTNALRVKVGFQVHLAKKQRS